MTWKAIGFSTVLAAIFCANVATAAYVSCRFSMEVTFDHDGNWIAADDDYISVAGKVQDEYVISITKEILQGLERATPFLALQKGDVNIFLFAEQMGVDARLVKKSETQFSVFDGRCDTVYADLPGWYVTE